MKTNTFYNLDKYILKFGQIHLDIKEVDCVPQPALDSSLVHSQASLATTNTFYNLDKYILKFGQIHLDIKQVDCAAACIGQFFGRQSGLLWPRRPSCNTTSNLIYFHQSFFLLLFAALVALHLTPFSPYSIMLVVASRFSSVFRGD